MDGVLKAGTVTAIGSLPHRDADAAAAFVLRHTPGLPALPQLPRRSPLEGMLAQAARGIAGVEVTDTGALVVDPSALDPAAPVDLAIDGASHAGVLAFLSLAAGRTGPVKAQLTGPITLGLALVDAGAPVDVAFAVAGAAVRARGAALVGLLQRRLPDAALVIFLDEPGLTSRLPIDGESAVDLLSSGLAVLEDHAISGVHCCGTTDWRLASAAGANILSLPVDRDGVLASATALNAHLERGGWIAWGAVPTNEPLGTDADRLWRRLSSVWCDLVQAGCDPLLLRKQALISPACGLAGHGPSQAARAFKLAATVAQRVTDQAAAIRLSAGA